MSYYQIHTFSVSGNSAVDPEPDGVIVVGAGVGGLATAIRLQAAGHDVTLIEAREQVGGRVSRLQDSGFSFDMGPAQITAPHLFEDLWTTAGRRFDEDVRLEPFSPVYRLYFVDGRHFDYGCGPVQDEEEVARFEPRDVQGYRDFLAATEQAHRQAFDDLEARPFNTLTSFARALPALLRARADCHVYSYVSRFFSDPYLRMVFSFHPLLIGGNPLRTSAFYSNVPNLARQGGACYASGGLYSVIQAMERLFKELGGRLVLSDPVDEILVRGGRVAGVKTRNGGEHLGAAVVANSDVMNTQLELVPPRYQRMRTRRRLGRYRHSPSYFSLFLGVNRRYAQLRHQTIIMPRDYQKLLRQLFDEDGLPTDLAFFLHAPSQTDPTMAPEGCESLTVMVPVPHLGHAIDWDRESDRFRDRIIRSLEHDFGLAGLSESIVSEHRFTPRDFLREFGSWLGSACSIEPSLFQSAYFRPHHRSDDLDGLYFVGAGTHPGAGIPGVLRSAEIASNLVNDEHPALGPSAAFRSEDTGTVDEPHPVRVESAWR